MQHLNLYSYGYNDPVDWSDPTGSQAMVERAELQTQTTVEQQTAGRAYSCTALQMFSYLALAMQFVGLAGSLLQTPADAGVNPTAADPLKTDRSIGGSPTQNQFLQDRIQQLRGQGASDIRVNQQQVDLSGNRVGINRPDLQYRLNGQRFYEEFDTAKSGRGIKHLFRTCANDIAGQVVLWTIN